VALVRKRNWRPEKNKKTHEYCTRNFLSFLCFFQYRVWVGLEDDLPAGDDCSWYYGEENAADALDSEPAQNMMSVL